MVSRSSGKTEPCRSSAPHRSDTGPRAECTSGAALGMARLFATESTPASRMRSARGDEVEDQPLDNCWRVKLVDLSLECLGPSLPLRFGTNPIHGPPDAVGLGLLGVQIYPDPVVVDVGVDVVLAFLDPGAHQRHAVGEAQHHTAEAAVRDVRVGM